MAAPSSALSKSWNDPRVAAGDIPRIAATPGSGLIGVGRHDLTIGTGAERPPDVHGDRVLDEPHAAVAETDVDPAGMEARGVDVVGVAGLGAAVVPAGPPLDRPAPVRRDDGVEHRVAH